MYRYIIIVMSALSFFLLSVNNIYAATPYQPLNPQIFQWVFSTARAGYYFNTQAMGYELSSTGDVDTNILIVPTVRLFDPMQIKDIQMKRQWHDKSIANFNNLVGTAEYLRINLTTKEVSYTDIRYLDRGYNPFAEAYTETPFNINKLADKDIRKDFINTIIEYADKHRQELLERAKKDANPESLKRIEELEKALPHNAIEEVTHHSPKDNHNKKKQPRTSKQNK